MKPPELKIPFNELPRIALMTMAFNPVYTKHSLINGYHQIYPADKIVHVLLHQEPYPPHLEHDLEPYQVVELDVPGKWAAVWCFKLYAFLEYCKQNEIKYMAFWDEDDIFPPYYLWAGMDNLLGKAKDSSATWTSDNLAVKRESVKEINYANPVGNSIGRVKLFSNVAAIMRMRYQNGNRNSNAKGAIDDIYWKLLDRTRKIYDRGDEIPLRAYVFHGLANTLVHRIAEENIDYDWEWKRSQV